MGAKKPSKDDLVSLLRNIVEASDAAEAAGVPFLTEDIYYQQYHERTHKPIAMAKASLELYSQP